jgi:2-polyprenyl-6-methoxyphenol hydroxylase-like FAD-dependent oxidoreductase
MQLEMHAGGLVRRLRLFDIGLEDTAFPFLLFVSQAETERVLTEYLAAGGLPVEQGLELITLASSRDQVDCKLRRRNGKIEEVSARHVIGCDGAHSTVRRLAEIPFEGAAYPQTFALGVACALRRGGPGGRERRARRAIVADARLQRPQAGAHRHARPGPRRGPTGRSDL